MKALVFRENCSREWNEWNAFYFKSNQYDLTDTKRVTFYKTLGVQLAGAYLQHRQHMPYLGVMRKKMALFGSTYKGTPMNKLNMH